MTPMAHRPRMNSPRWLIWDGVKLVVVAAMWIAILYGAAGGFDR
jgi:hypothetical protein